MKTAIIGKKVGMTQIFDEAGKVVPVTVIEAGPCTVTGKMTTEKEGYEAVQLGYEDIAEKKLTKPEKGHLDKAGVGYKKHLKEFRLEDCASVNVGDVIKADTFKEGDKVDITGILDVVKVDPELNMIVVRGAIPGPKGGIVYIKSTVKKTVVKKGDAGISTNPQKASGRNPQKASARK